MYFPRDRIAYVYFGRHLCFCIEETLLLLYGFAAIVKFRGKGNVESLRCLLRFKIPLKFLLNLWIRIFYFQKLNIEGAKAFSPFLRLWL